VNIGERTKRPYDPAKDLAPISKAAESPFILVATPTLNAKSLQDVIKLARAEPGRLSIGHGGNGTAMQLAALMLVSMADVKINQVPYRGTAPVVTDTIAGHVQLGIADPVPSMGAIGQGKLKALAVSSRQRFAMLPDVPTFAELGLKDFELTAWLGIVAPGGTPREIAARLNDAIVSALKDPEVVRRIRAIGMEPVPTTREEFVAYIDSEIAKASKVQAASDKPN
jgi:tripartite-type tricarboxylate transporter receptor subunit TctC